MKNIGLNVSVSLFGGLLLQLAAAEPAAAQTTTAPSSAANTAGEELTEIIVTARKRDETALSTPEIMDVIRPEQIQTERIIDMPSLAAATPGLTIQPSAAAAGAQVNLRGLGNGLESSFVDQSVLLNLDSVPLSNGSYYYGALFDVGQIEILKGPQALFYGKSATGGIIAVHSADPTSSWVSKITESYEFNAEEVGTEAFVSGPITNYLGIRIAGFYRHMNGYLDNTDPAARETWSPQGPAGGGRITLKYENDTGLKADLKYSLVAQHNNGSIYDEGQTACTGSEPQIAKLAPYENCKIDNTTNGAPAPKPYIPGPDGLGSAYSIISPPGYGGPGFLRGTPNPLFGNGVPDFASTISNLSLTVDYDIIPELRFTSVSSFSTSNTSDVGSIFQNAYPPQASVAVAGAQVEIASSQEEQDYSQELRFTSSFNGMLNFMAGGFFSRSIGAAGVAVVDQTEQLVPNTSLSLPTGVYLYLPIHVATQDWSPFAQLTFTPVQQLELNVGARYTDVHKYLTSVIQSGNVAAGEALQGVIIPQGDVLGLIPSNLTSVHEYNFSPETTLTWRPTDMLTTFVSYKQGYKGPAFNISAQAYTFVDAPPGTINPVKGELVKGIEGGIKGSFLDRSLQASLGAYDYKYTDLQVSYDNAALNTDVLANAAAARIFGVEFDSTYLLPMVSGLRLNASVYYNNAKYLSFPLAPCYNGQSPQQGCVGGSVYGTGGTQNLAGQQLVNAPFVTGRVGVAYDWNVGGRYRAGAGVSSELSTGYNTDTTRNPNALQGGYALLDANLRFGAASGAWEVALIGRDLANRYIKVAGTDTNGKGVVGVPADATVEIARPLQVDLQVTVKPQEW